jgi:hypothetical protein
MSTQRRPLNDFSSSYFRMAFLFGRNLLSIRDYESHDLPLPFKQTNIQTMAKSAMDFDQVLIDSKLS